MKMKFSIFLSIIALVVALNAAWAQTPSPTPTECCPPCGDAGQLCGLYNTLWTCSTNPDGSCPLNTYIDCPAGYFCDDPDPECDAACKPWPTPSPTPTLVTCMDSQPEVKPVYCTINGATYGAPSYYCTATITGCTDATSGQPCQCTLDPTQTGTCNARQEEIDCSCNGIPSTGMTYDPQPNGCVCDHVGVLCE